MSRVDDILYSPMLHRSAKQIASQPAPAESGTIKANRPAQIAVDADRKTVIVILDCNPLYECTAQCFLAGRLLDPGARIIWNDTPNHAMKPLNDAAKECYSRFISRVGPE